MDRAYVSQVLEPTTISPLGDRQAVWPPVDQLAVKTVECCA